MVGTAISLIFGGSFALLAGGGAHAVTRSHYQRRLRDLEGKLREARDALSRSEKNLEIAEAELARLQTLLAARDRRLGELAASIAALRDLAVDLDRRITAHSGLMRRAVATITMRRHHHEREGEIMRKRLVRAQRSLATFNQEETSLQTEVTGLRASIAEQSRAVADAEEQFRATLAEEQTCEAEIQAGVSA